MSALTLAGVLPMTGPNARKNTHIYILPGIVIGSLRWRIIPAHYQQPRQNMDEHASHPRRHHVGLRRTEVNVEDHHCYAYTAKYKRDRRKCEKPARNSSLGVPLTVPTLRVSSTNVAEQL